MKEKSQIKERILQFVDNQGIPREEFCTKVGITSSNFRGTLLFSDPNARIVSKVFLLYPQLNPDWLLNGKGEMLRCVQNYDTPAEIASLEAKVMKTEKDRQCRELAECERKLREREEYIICLHEKISKIQQELIERQQEMLNHFSALLSKK